MVGSEASVGAEARVSSRRRIAQRVPWRDRSGRVSALKIVALIASVAPAFWLVLRLVFGDLGARPVHDALLATGLWSVRFLLLSLAVTPARLVFDAPRLTLIRRILGLTGAAYAFAHLVLYAVDENLKWSFILQQMFGPFFLLIGTISLIFLAMLAATSTDAALRRMGALWRKLHLLAYAAIFLALWHFALAQKLDVGPAVLPAGMFLWLMTWRLLPHAWQKRPSLLAVLGVGSAVGTAGLEALWYGLATGVSPVLVLKGQFSLQAGLTPAWWVGLVGLGIAAAAAFRTRLRFAPARRPTGHSARI